MSFFTDLSSEILYPVIPFFLTSTLGAPASILGLIEGMAEAVSAVVKGLSGPLSDRMSKRKPFVFAGYSLSSVSKLAFALSPVWGFALFFRLCERIGKGVRTPARDALIADVTDESLRGRAFGFHRAMDTWGAVLGSSLAFVLLPLFHDDFRTVMLLSLVPAFFAVLIILRLREKPKRETANKVPVKALLFSPPRSRGYLRFVFVYAVFSLGASSATFLILRARSIGFSFATALLPYIIANIVYALTSERIGRLSDRTGRRGILVFGMSVFAASYFIIFLFPSKAALIAALSLYGLYLAATEGIGKAFVTDMVKSEEYGRALGFFYFLTGTATLAASLVAGALWDRVSQRAPFLQGALCAAAAIVLFSLLVRRDVPGVRGASDQ